MYFFLREKNNALTFGLPNLSQVGHNFLLVIEDESSVIEDESSVRQNFLSVIEYGSLVL